MEPISAFFLRMIGNTNPTVAISTSPHITLGCMMSFLQISQEGDSKATPLSSVHGKVRRNEQKTEWTLLNVR
jgi:hypothetical protein